MQTAAIVLVGVALVLVGVLWLRLHAFLALLLAAGAVAALSPARLVERSALRDQSSRATATDPAARNVSLRPPNSVKLQPGDRLAVLWFDAGQQQPHQVATVEVIAASGKPGEPPRFLALVEQADDDFQWTGRELVVPPAALAEARRAAAVGVGQRVANALGGTCASVAILIAMASIIGKCLLDSGAADRIVRTALALVGQAAAPLSLVASGFVLGIPVFFDTVFYLMMPLGKALRVRTGGHYLLYVLSIVAGATMAHSLVPPTPGPLFVAEQLGVDLGVMIFGGVLVGIVASGSGYLYALWLDRRWVLPLRDTPEMSLEELLRQTTAERPTPPLWLSLAPIVLPVALIGGQTIVETLLERRAIAADAPWLPAVSLLGDKNVAITLAAVIALAMLAWVRRRSRAELSHAVQAALASGGVIILITSAGGAFGAMLKQTDIAGLLTQLDQRPTWQLLTAGFLLTTAIRTAQGSATVAMITAVGILANLADPAVLGCHPVYMALAIGCGSKPLAWMNDSGFWVICKMSGMTEAEGLRAITPFSLLMGVMGHLAVLAGAWLWPLV